MTQFLADHPSLDAIAAEFDMIDVPPAAEQPTTAPSPPPPPSRAAESGTTRVSGSILPQAFVSRIVVNQ